MMTIKKTLIGLTLSLGISQFAFADLDRRYESNQKIDRIQVNKMVNLKREFKKEINYGNSRYANFIKYDIIVLAKKDIRFQQKKIYELERLIDNNSNIYYRKEKSNRRTNRNSNYYEGRNSNSRNSTFDLRDSRRKLRILRNQLLDKQELLHDLEHNHSTCRNNELNDLRTVRAIIQNMQDDVDLHYNNNVDSPFYRKSR